MPQGEGTYGSEVGRPPKKNSPMGYNPFKMKGHELPGIKQRTPNALKSFGTKDSDMPDGVSTSPGKFMGGIFGGGGLRKMIEKLKAAKAAKKQSAVVPGEESEAGGEAGDTMMGRQAEMAQDVESGDGGGGEVPKHGPEAHAGGGGIGVMKKKMNPFQSMMGGGGVGAMFSDSRLKEKIERTGVSPSGIPIYEFNYIGSNSRYSGAMAQDLLEINPDAVTMDTSGFYKVNYNNIDVDMHQINN